MYASCGHVAWRSPPEFLRDLCASISCSFQWPLGSGMLFPGPWQHLDAFLLLGKALPRLALYYSTRMGLSCRLVTRRCPFDATASVVWHEVGFLLHRSRCSWNLSALTRAVLIQGAMGTLDDCQTLRSGVGPVYWTNETLRGEIGPAYKPCCKPQAASQHSAGFPGGSLSIRQSRDVADARRCTVWQRQILAAPWPRQQRARATQHISRRQRLVQGLPCMLCTSTPACARRRRHMPLCPPSPVPLAMWCRPSSRCASHLQHSVQRDVNWNDWRGY